ncbi:MAG: cation:proton antiporter [archaeon]|nr:cation:proton antiporter [archaeon]
MAEEALLFLSLIIIISAVLTVIARMIKQPPIIAYLIAGIIVGPLFLNLIGPLSPSTALIQVFAHLGVAFLLFIVGFSLDFRVLKEVGKVAVFGGIAQITVTGFIGYFIAISMGFTNVSSLYIAAGLVFSSTVVVVKILADKKEIDTLHGRIALGILIVQDFVAAIMLMIVPLIKTGTVGIIANNILLIILLIGTIFFVSHFFFGRMLDYLARSHEVLFLFGIAWALFLATVFDRLGFSLEIGALIAGMTLASTKYTLELGGKIKPLRDFFVVLFFVFFGSQLGGGITSTLVWQAIILSIFVTIGKPIIVMGILKVFGYKKRTNFLAGASLGQISEFSLILTLLGFSLAQLPREIMTLSILVAVITIGVSSYGIYYAHPIFEKISKMLFMFEGRKEKKEKKIRKYDVILFGYHRIGYKLLETLKDMKVPFVVVDYNPKVILALSKQGINCIYGDAGDREFLSDISLENAKLVISTIPDAESNRAIIEELGNLKSKAAFIATAEQPRTAIDLYHEGIDYVIIPHHLGGDYASEMIKKYKTSKAKYRKAGLEHNKKLERSKNSSTFM